MSTHAEKMNALFFEVLIAPSYDDDALEILRSKKNRVLLILKDYEAPAFNVRTVLNGTLVQAKDALTESESDMETVTKLAPSEKQIADMIFAAKVCKHTKSNTIVLAKDGQLLAMVKRTFASFIIPISFIQIRHTTIRTLGEATLKMTVRDVM